MNQGWEKGTAEQVTFPVLVGAVPPPSRQAIAARARVGAPAQNGLEPRMQPRLACGWLTVTTVATTRLTKHLWLAALRILTANAEVPRATRLFGPRRVQCEALHHTQAAWQPTSSGDFSVVLCTYQVDAALQLVTIGQRPYKSRLLQIYWSTGAGKQTCIKDLDFRPCRRLKPQSNRFKVQLRLVFIVLGALNTDRLPPTTSTR